MQTTDFIDVETALSKIHNIPEDRFPAFRARLQNFKRLNVVPSSGGRGRRLAYSRDTIYLLAFAVELAQFGVEPATIKKMIDVYSAPIINSFEYAGRSTEDIYLLFSPNVVTNPPERAENSVWLLHQYGESLISASAIKSLLGRRAGLVNISEARRALDRALPAG